MNKPIETYGRAPVESGAIFNRLIVISEDYERSNSKRRYILCACICNKDIKSYRYDGVKSGRIKSCGCFQKDVVKKITTTHGMSKTPEYHVWQNIKERCYNKNNPQYKDYGERGITVCDRWLESFENFYEDMGERPSKEHDIDKINNNGNYEKDNCRWALRDIGNHNKRKPENCSSVYKGVYYDTNKSKFITRLYKNKKLIFSGSFVNEFDAAVSYDNVSEQCYGDRPNKTTRE